MHAAFLLCLSGLFVRRLDFLNGMLTALLLICKASHYRYASSFQENHIVRHPIIRPLDVADWMY